MANRKVILYGEDLKLWLLENQIDKETGKKISIRELLRTKGEDIGMGTRPSNFNFHCNHVDIINSLPYKGEPVTEDLVYKYGIERGWVKETFEEFSKQYNKKMNKLDDGTVMRAICKELNHPSPKDLIKLDSMERSLRFIYGNAKFESIKNKVEKTLKGR